MSSVEHLCCHQMGQGNLSREAAMLGIASSWQADGTGQARMRLVSSHGYLHVMESI
jgi:hypothetical protein